MTYLVAAIVAMTNMCGVVTVDTRGARVLSYVPEGGGESLPAVDADGAADGREFEFVGINRVGNTSTMTLRSKPGSGGKPDDERANASLSLQPLTSSPCAPIPPALGDKRYENFHLPGIIQK